MKAGRKPILDSVRECAIDANGETCHRFPGAEGFSFLSRQGLVPAAQPLRDVYWETVVSEAYLPNRLGVTVKRRARRKC
jgi:hypothetical protein